MRRQKRIACLAFAVMMLAVCLTGCGSQQDAQQKVQAIADGLPSDPDHHEAYGISYEMPQTHWTYMFNSDELGTGTEYIDFDIESVESDKSLEDYWKEERDCGGLPEGELEEDQYKLKDSGIITIGDRDCYWYDATTGGGDVMLFWKKVLLLPQADENKYIVIRSDFIETSDKGKADAIFKKLTKGIVFTENKGYYIDNDYLSVGGTWIPLDGIQPVQLFYGLMDEDETGGFVSGQVSFNQEDYPKDLDEMLSEDVEDDEDDGSSLGDQGDFESEGIKGKWYTVIDALPDSMTYLTFVVLVPSEDAKAIISFAYDFDGDVDDPDQYQDRMEELKSHIQLTETND